MKHPRIGERIKFTDRYNGLRLEGKVCAIHLDDASGKCWWTVAVDTFDGERIGSRPKLSVVPSEIDEIIN